MKMHFWGKIMALFVLAMTVVGCSKVEPGHVGIRVSNFGDRGVQGEVVEPGRYVWNGPGYQLYEYPVFKQNATWTKENGRQVTFQTADGMSVGADVGITYNVGHACVADFFKEFRVDIDQVTDKFVYNNVRNAFTNAAANMKVDQVYGAGKVSLLANVKAAVRKELGPKCLSVEDVYLVSNFDLPPNVQQAINQKIQATQMAEQRQNEVAQAKAEAEKAVAEARGQADSQLLRAEADARAIQIKGDALRNNPSLVELERVNALKILYSNCKGDGCQPVPTTIIGADANMLYQLGGNK